VEKPDLDIYGTRMRRKNRGEKERKGKEERIHNTRRQLYITAIEPAIFNEDPSLIVSTEFSQKSRTYTTASISQDYWGGTQKKTGGRKSPQRRPGAEVSQKLKVFCETTHNICVKIQQTTVAVTRVDILNDITSKILGGTLGPTMDVPPS